MWVVKWAQEYIQYVGVNVIRLLKGKVCMCWRVSLAHTQHPPHRLSPTPPTLQPTLEHFHLKHTPAQLVTAIHRLHISSSSHSLSPSEQKGLKVNTTASKYSPDAAFKSISHLKHIKNHQTAAAIWLVFIYIPVDI